MHGKQAHEGPGVTLSSGLKSTKPICVCTCLPYLGQLVVGLVTGSHQGEGERVACLADEGDHLVVWQPLHISRPYAHHQVTFPYAGVLQG